MGPSLALLEHVFCYLNRPFDQLAYLGLRGLLVTWWNSHISKTSENSAPPFPECQILQIWLSFYLSPLVGGAVFCCQLCYSSFRRRWSSSIWNRSAATTCHGNSRTSCDIMGSYGALYMGTVSRLDSEATISIWPCMFGQNINSCARFLHFPIPICPIWIGDNISRLAAVGMTTLSHLNRSPSITRSSSL